MNLRYLATRLGLSDQPPSASLADLTGRDELSILGDVGECSSFTFDFIRKFNMGICTGGGVDGPLVTTAVSRKVTDGDGDEGIIISMQGTSESGGDKYFISVFLF